VLLVAVPEKKQFPARSPPSGPGRGPGPRNNVVAITPLRCRGGLQVRSPSPRQRRCHRGPWPKRAWLPPRARRSSNRLTKCPWRRST